MKRKRVPKANLVTSACQAACPAGIDVPRYVRAIQAGEFDQALAVIRERIPFPSVCGYACYSPCEANCGNRQYGEAVAIRALKRSAAELGGELWKKGLAKAQPTGKKVAVVGSGPSGLTAAYYLACLGHEVTVFEAQEKLGGMMRLGIPAYRLPRQALDQEIALLAELGVVFKTGTRVDSAQKLLKDGFAAVYLALGAAKGAKLGVPGEDLPGVVDGIGFLREVNLGRGSKLGRRVAIIGGGNTAVDAARSAIRVGAQEVTVFYRRTAEEMTAYAEEVAGAKEEGVRFEFLAAPKVVAAKEGTLAVTLIKMRLGKPDASGRPAPLPVAGSEFVREFDAVIAAVGQAVDLPATMDVEAASGRVKVDQTTLAASRPGVFAGGDVVSGPRSIIEAIAAGRLAAAGIDKHLGGRGDLTQKLAEPEDEVLVLDYVAGQVGRSAGGCIPLANRVCGFETVELGLGREGAVKEASRCRSCDARQYEVKVDEAACKECGYCLEVCKCGVYDKGKKFNAKGYRAVVVDNPQRCVGCLACFFSCPDWAITVAEKEA